MIGLASVALVAAACAASAPPVGIATLASAAPGSGAAADVGPSASAENPEQAALDFAACMRSRGVNVPDPGAPPGAVGPTPDPNSPAFQPAVTACQQYLSAIKQVKPGAPLTTHQQDAYLRWAGCMRSHGVGVPDPQFPPGGGIEYPGGVSLHRLGLDPNSTAFQAAQHACQSILTNAGVD